MMLDRSRNSLIKFEIFASALAAASGVGSSVAGIFGMNLQTPLYSPDDGTKFTLVASFVGGFCTLVALCTSIFLFCRRGWLKPIAISGRVWHIATAATNEASAPKAAVDRQLSQLLPTRAQSAREGWKKRFVELGSVRSHGRLSRGGSKADLIGGSVEREPAPERTASS